MFTRRRRLGLGQWDIIGQIAQVIVPAATSVFSAVYSGGVAQDVAQVNADTALRVAQINASIKQMEIDKIASLQASSTPTTSALSASMAGFPTWAWIVLGGMAFMMLGRGK
jgi:hypothetical protein